MSRTYEQLEPVISALDERIKTGLGAFPTDTAEGSIVSFPDGAYDVPLKSLVVNIDPVQSGSGDPSPDNVRPISGWTGMNVTRYGKNYIQDSDTSYSLTASMMAKYTPVASLADITSGTFSVEAVVPSGQTLKLFGYDGADNNFIWDLTPQGDGRYAVTSNGNTIKRAKEFRIYSQPYTGGSSVVTVISKAMLVVNDTETDYEPYSGQTISINWESEAGTVYGGKLDVISGVLTIEKATVILNGIGVNWTYDKDNITGRCRCYTTNFSSNIKPLSTIISDRLISDDSTRSYPLPRCVTSNVYSTVLIGVDERISSATDFNSWLSENPITLCYELRTPITIQLTPHQVNSLYGINNIFADTGDTEVEYRADTTLYIERLIAPDSADMIADSNIVSGQYFMVSNALYKATANIASGSAVIVGTNCTQKSLSEALNEINS